MSVTDKGTDRVQIGGGSGTDRPPTLKVTVGFDGGFLGEGGISYAGPNAVARAELARDILRERLGRHDGFADGLRLDIIGLDSLHGTADIRSKSEAYDVRVRVAMRSMDRGAIETMLWEVESLLCCGPSGGGGFRGQVSPSVITHSALIERDIAKPTVRVLTA